MALDLSPVGDPSFSALFVAVLDKVIFDLKLLQQTNGLGDCWTSNKCSNEENWDGPFIQTNVENAWMCRTPLFLLLCFGFDEKRCKIQQEFEWACNYQNAYVATPSKWATSLQRFQWACPPLPAPPDRNIPGYNKLGCIISPSQPFEWTTTPEHTPTAQTIKVAAASQSVKVALLEELGVELWATMPPANF